MADNNMESLLMGGDDSSSGESDDEVQVTGGTAASAVMPTPSPAPAPAAPTPAPAPMSHAARLKDLYNSQPKRTPGSTNTSASASASTPAPATAPPPAAAPAPRPTPTMQPPPRQMAQPPSSAPNSSAHPSMQSMQSMQSRPSHTSHPHQQHPQSTQPPPQQHQQQPQQPHRHVAPAPVYKPPTAAAPPPSSQPQSAPRMQDPFAPTPLQHIKDRHQQKVEAQQRAQQQQMQMPHPSMQSQSRPQPTSHPPPSHQPHYSSQHPSQPPQQQRIPSAPAPAPPSYHHPPSQQPRQQPRQHPPPQAMQRMPQQQQPTAQQPQDRAAMEREVRKQKEKFLMLTRVLIKYLEQKDAKLHHEAKMIIRDCNIRNKKGERGYESVTAAMKERLKALVGEQYWKRAEAYLKHFLDQKKAQIAQGTTSGRPAGAPVPPTAPSQPSQVQPPRMEQRKIEPPGGKSGKHPAATAPAAAAVAQGTSPILQQMQREIATQKAKVASQGKGASVGKKQPRRKSNTGPAAARKTVGAAAAATPAAATPHVAAPVVAVDPNTLPPREYNELMKLVDHAIDYDWTTAGLLLGSKTDLQLTDEQQHLLYTSGKDSTSSASGRTDAWGQPKPSTGLRPGWGTRNVVSARTAWSLVRLREQNRSGVGDVGLTLPGSINGNSTIGGLNSNNNSNSNASTKELADTSWLNDEKAEQDVVLAMLSEATEVYLKVILERAVGCARQRLNVNGIRLWHQQHVAGATSTPAVPPQTAAAASQGNKPALALRLGCDVTRQAALASGNAAMTVQRMEQALARQSLPTRDRILQGETLETAQGMSDLSLRPQLAKGAENAELEGKRCFEVSGGKHAMEPPLGRVPKQAKLEVVDFQMGSHLVENVGRHWTSNAATSIYF